METRVAASWRAFYRRASDLYGITPAQYRLMYVGQKGRCWICRKVKGIHPDDPKGRGTRRLGIDHNHATGAVRGLLCTYGDKSCNRVIGWLDRAGLMRAVGYLDDPPAMSILPLIGSGSPALALPRDELDALAVGLLWP